MVKRVLVVGNSGELSRQVKDLDTSMDGSYNLQMVGEQEFNETCLELSADYILLDSNLIENDGIQSLRKITQNQLTEQTPVFLLTDDPDPNKISKLLELGISDFMMKPLDGKELFCRLQTTQQKKNNSKTKKESELLPQMDLEAESTTNAIIQLNPRGDIDWANKGFEEIYEYTLEEYLKDNRHYIFSQNSKGLKLALEKFKSGDKGLTFEHQIETKSGESKWIQTTLTPLFDDNETLTKLLVVETDITRLYMDKLKTEQLLANLFPHEISEQLKRKGRAKSKKYRMATVLFADFENFTTLTKSMSVDELITELNRYVRRFDEIIDDHYLEKIKTMGDAYMCAGGLPLKNYSNPFDVTLASLEIQKFVSDMAQVKESWGERPWNLRIGIHTGRVMAGVIGSKKFAYDIWGNTVNIASRMEDMSKVGMVNVSETTYEYIKDYFDCTYRGKLAIKNLKDEVAMYFVNRLKPEYAEDEEGIYPNATFRKILAKY
jgi:PAS domain S-box-containing protein